MKRSSFKIRDRVTSFSYAIKGLRTLVKDEHNYRIHLVISLITVILGFVFQLNVSEWISIVLAMGLVLVAEIVNTAIERIVDFISPGYNEPAGLIKDIGAGAVLVSSCIAVIVGVLVFLPKII
jgi:diacylglycerol kinase